jgi:hypothetical protein
MPGVMELVYELPSVLLVTRAELPLFACCNPFPEITHPQYMLSHASTRTITKERDDATFLSLDPVVAGHARRINCPYPTASHRLLTRELVWRI